MFLLAVGTTSTKIAGAGWLLLVLFGAWANWRWPAVATDSVADHALERAVLAWLLLSAAAFALRIPPLIYWNDPLGDRHVEFRVVMVGMVTLGLVRRIRLNQQQLTLFGTVLALASGVAFVLVSLKGRALPSDAIVWADFVMFMVCVLIPLIPRIASHSLQMLALSIGVLLACASVLMTGSRGVYPALLWPIGAALALLWVWPIARRKVLSGVLLVVVVLITVATFQPKVWQFPMERAFLGWGQAMALIKGKEQPEIQAIENAVGLRLYMWQRAPEAIRKSPWMGLGKEGSIAEIRSWGKDTGSKYLGAMTHLHNDWLNAAINHGIFGVASILLFLLAPIVAARTLWRQMRLPAVALLGIAFTQGVATLTNTIFPNYYGVMYSLMTGLVFVSAITQKPGNKPTP